MKGYVIKWRNRYSGEEGFVEKISVKEKHFVNTYDPNKAHLYTRKSSLTSALKTLEDIGETVNNVFYVAECN